MSTEADDDLIARALAYLKGEMGGEDRARFEEQMAESPEARKSLEQARALLDSLSAASDASVVRRVDALIVRALDSGASDLHIVPERRGVAVRVRRDGVLQDIDTLPGSLGQAVADRWKVMCDLNVHERRLPQEGRVPLRHAGTDFDLRVSVLPTLYGERVTARILNRSEVRVGLEYLGYTDAQLSALKRLARLRAGLILVGGWADTGKSTLLYSLILEAQAADLPSRNILTVEDPVELQLPGVSQVAVSPTAGLDFPAALRGVLHSDPDVILCGDLRDAESAALCVEAASAGRLVLASVPVANALAIVEHLRGLGVPDFRIADSVVALVGLQLVRRVDERDTEEYAPSEDALTVAGLGGGDGPFRRGVPDERNGHTGFLGRIPLVEIAGMNDRLRRRVAEGVAATELAGDAFPGGRGSLREDARDRVRAGMTTVEEVNWALSGYPRL